MVARPGERGYAPSFATVVKDVDCFVRHLCQTHEKRPENMVVLAQSVGAVTVATWVHDYAPRIRAMILAAPALEIKLYVPLAIPGLRLLLKMRKDRKTFIKSYVKARMLTHDREQARRYEQDSLIARDDCRERAGRPARHVGAADRRRGRHPRADPAVGGRSGLGREARPATETVRAARHAGQADEGLPGDVP